jgi:hypothetical protein
MRTLDPVERKWGFAVGAVPLVVALVNLAVHAKVSVLKPLVLGRCLAPGHLVGKSCTELVTQKASVPEVALLAFLGIVIMLSVWRSMRTLVAVATIFAGLASGLLGIVSIFYGGWLLLRSWRLQRYGVKDGAGVRKVATERAAVKREAKKSPLKLDAAGTKPVTSSKRYTPKAKPRKR